MSEKLSYYLFFDFGIYLILIPGLAAAFAVYMLFIRKSVSGILKKTLLPLVIFLLTGLAAVILKHNIVSIPAAAAASFCLGAVIAPAVFLASKLISRIEDTGFIGRNSPGIVIFLYLAVQMFEIMPDKIDEWGSIWYACDYSMGPGSRFLIGSIIRIFHPDFIYARDVYRICVVVCVIIMLLIAFMLNRLINSVEENRKTAVIYLTAMFLSFPGSPASVWLHIGKLELFGLLTGLWGGYHFRDAYKYLCEIPADNRAVMRFYGNISG